MSASDSRRAVEAVFRMEQARLIAGLARILRDVGLAEELAQDALLVALQTWPQSGVPRNPGAWLMQTAKRRAIDYFRRNSMAARKLDELGHGLREEEQRTPDFDSALDDDYGDDLLRLIFTSCHPLLKREARVALTLRLIGGLSTNEIARAFLVSEPTVAQRIVRAKRTLAEQRVPFEVPHGKERLHRLASVLEVVYLIFNEGYAATSGSDWTRPQLCHDAMRLGRILARLAPGEPEVHGLLALMEIQASRLAARRGPQGQPIPLLEQDRSRWDQLLIRRGLANLESAMPRGGERGPYALQAAIAACHARARRAEHTDWQAIARLYDLLAMASPSPVVELNRAMAHGLAFGPAVGLALLDALGEPAELAGYHLLPGARGELLERAGDLDGARLAFESAAALARNDSEREHLLARAAKCLNASRGDADTPK